mgnify:CR=1 FL=1
MKEAEWPRKWTLAHLTLTTIQGITLLTNPKNDEQMRLVLLILILYSRIKI